MIELIDLQTQQARIKDKSDAFVGTKYGIICANGTDGLQIFCSN